MPRKRKKTAEQQQADMGAAPQESSGGKPTEAVATTATDLLDATPAVEQAAQEAATRSEKPNPKLRGVAVEVIGNRRVRLIDNGNLGGVGIKIEGLPDGERPSEEVMGILRANAGVKLVYRNDMDKSWMVRVDPMNPSGTRRAVEQKFTAVVEQMRKEEEGQTK